MRTIVWLSLLMVNLVWADSSELFIPSAQSQITRVELFQFTSPEKQRQAIELAKSLRCPQCQNQNLVESNSPIALDLRLLVFEKINQGQSEQQVIDFMTARYGDFVLYKPPFVWANALLWGLPVFMLLLFLLHSATRIRKGRYALAEVSSDDSGAQRR